MLGANPNLHHNIIRSVKMSDTMQTFKLNFGQALALLKQGYKVQRCGWNGKGMFVYLVPAMTYKAQTEAIRCELGENIDYAAYLALKGTSNVINTWVPSISDCLSEDWQIVE